MRKVSVSDLTDGLKYDAHGLVPAVIQDAMNRQVLMVGYMNAEAVRRTLESGRVTFWSRSRQCYWTKGETSGNTQTVREVRVDCDKDCILILVDQVGEACHDGYRTCFYRQVTSDGELLIVEPRLREPEQIYGGTTRAEGR